MKLQRLHLLITLVFTILIFEEHAQGQICDDWKSQSTAYVVTGSTPDDPGFYQWEEKANNMHGVHLCVLNADVIPVYIQQNNNYINFTTRFGPSTALLFMLQVEVSVNSGGYTSIYSGSAKQDVVWFNSSSAFPNTGNYDLMVRVTFFDGTIRYRQYEIKVIPQARKLYKDNVGNTLRKWNGNDPYGKNAIVFSEGFDAYNTNGQEMYYHAAADLIQCFNDNGYDVFLLDNFFGTQDIRNNAAVFSSAVFYISTLYNDEFVVAGGVSMGGIIARYALAKAEQQGSPLPAHTFIAIDSPHQGAIISEPLQNFKKENEEGDEFAKYALSNIAARQLLNYNAYDQDGTAHQTFFQELNSLNGNGYPHLTKNIGVSFSTNDPSPHSGGWYKITYHTGPISGTIKTFDLTDVEKQAGSWLPKDLTTMSPIIQQASYWWLQLLVPGITPLYYPTIDFERFTDPAYIPYYSALDIRNSNSQFDVCIEPENTSWHDVLPSDIVEEVINQVILTDTYYQNKELYGAWSLRGKKVAAGNYVTLLYPKGDVNVHPPGALYIEASDRVMLRDGFSVRYGATAHFIADPNLHYECGSKTGNALTKFSSAGSQSFKEHDIQTDILVNKKLVDGFNASLYPNPATDKIQIRYSGEAGRAISLEIYNIQGVNVYCKYLEAGDHHEINIGNLSKGYYVARISNGSSIKALPFVKI
ncbi:MAG: T9SS type A sorting domain-containing protein [Bacteroidales bacterium]|nr:T9SS type A sorting domain-containing protein [Bacteroidales bacterium]